MCSLFRTTPLDKAAPLPLRRYHALFAARALEGGPGKKVAIVGMGGLAIWA